MLLCIVGVLVAVPAIHQDEHYHDFAGHAVIFGIPNFWNVISNAAFLIAALIGFRALHAPRAFANEWERSAYGVLLLGVALTAFGSGYYHLYPTTQTLFWDRLPMTFVFMSILSTTIGERISMKAGRRALIPLLLTGALSVVYWRFSGDLRWYGLVQFIPMLTIPAMLLFFPPYYSSAAGTWGMLGLYSLAKIAELFDRQIGQLIPAGGHPWKHVAGAAAVICYALAVGRRHECRGN